MQQSDSGAELPLPISCYVAVHVAVTVAVVLYAGVRPVCPDSQTFQQQGQQQPS
jgi:hypothetical protein